MTIPALLLLSVAATDSSSSELWKHVLDWSELHPDDVAAAPIRPPKPKVSKAVFLCEGKIVLDQKISRCPRPDDPH